MEYKKMAAIFGSIIFIAFVTFFVSVLWLAESRIFFTRDYIIYIKFDDVSGLKEQAPVYMRGFKIGRVRSVRFEPGCVVVRADINKKFLVPKGSVAEIVALNILGEKAIRIVPSDSKEYIQNREVIEGVNKDIMLEIKRVLSQIRRPIEERNVELWLDRIEEMINNVAMVTNNLRKEIVGLKLKESVNNVGEAGKEVSKLVKNTSPQLKQTLEELQRQLKNLDQTLKQMHATFARTEEVLKNVQEGKGSVGRIYRDDELVKRLEKTLQELENLIQDIKKNPKKYFKFSIF